MDRNPKYSEEIGTEGGKSEDHMAYKARLWQRMILFHEQIEWDVIKTV